LCWADSLNMILNEYRVFLHRPAFINLFFYYKKNMSRYKVAVAVEPGDAILMDGHEPHCNTELTIKNDGTRFSMVCYIREDMYLFHRPVLVDDHLYYIE